MKIDVWIILDVLIIAFGIYQICSWFQMKKTGQVSKRILMRNGLQGRPCRDKQGYFEAIFRPTLIAGLGSLFTGVINLTTEILKTGAIVNMIITIAFLVVVFWYSKQVSNATKKFYL